MSADEETEVLDVEAQEAAHATWLLQFLAVDDLQALAAALGISLLPHGGAGGGGGALHRSATVLGTRQLQAAIAAHVQVFGGELVGHWLRAYIGNLKAGAVVLPAGAGEVVLDESDDDIAIAGASPAKRSRMSAGGGVGGGAGGGGGSSPEVEVDFSGGYGVGVKRSHALMAAEDAADGGGGGGGGYPIQRSASGLAVSGNEFIMQAPAAAGARSGSAGMAGGAVQHSSSMRASECHARASHRDSGRGAVATTSIPLCRRVQRGGLPHLHGHLHGLSGALRASWPLGRRCVSATEALLSAGLKCTLFASWVTVCCGLSPPP